jgi:predicted O-linked N-acetylglucosamine transferase (SPINDLY family)
MWAALSLQAAPLQVLLGGGFAGTGGASFVQSIVTDTVVSPPNMASHYSERLAYVPSMFPTEEVAGLGGKKPPPLKNDADHRKLNSATGVSSDGVRTLLHQDGSPLKAGVLLSSFNQIYKVTPPLYDTWNNVLRRLPAAVLWMLQGQNGATTSLSDEAMCRGVNAKQIYMSAGAERNAHLKRIEQADCHFDSPVYNSHTTGVDTLRSGVPMIGILGEKMATRIGVSLLHNSLSPQWQAHSMKEYEDLSVSYMQPVARTLDSPSRHWKREIRRGLGRGRGGHIKSGQTSVHDAKERAVPLYELLNYTVRLEKVFVLLWEAYTAGSVKPSTGQDIRPMLPPHISVDLPQY